MRPLPQSRRLLHGLGVPLLLGAIITASAPGWTTIRISRGDNLTKVAARYHTTVAALVALNKLPGNGNLIYAGATLRVPVPPPPPRPPGPAMRETTYLVKSGDTLIGIAHRYHNDRSWIARRNHLPASGMVRIGQRLVVLVPAPPPKPTSATAARRSYPPAVTAAAARDRAILSHRKAPSRAGVRALVVSTAHRYGVDASLALAVAYQESGFQQRVVSPADAIGAMQVLPSTGRYISDYVVHRRLDLFDARDNVVAGVALLARLLRAAPVEQAVAGYYQGLGSVRSRGMFTDTKAYVANVLRLRGTFAGG
jgi:LysM repeat protein